MKLVILDRDGVINRDSAQFIKSAQEWVALPGSLNAIARLNEAGWKVVIASNQSGLARGLFDMDALNGIHAKMRRELAQAGGNIDAIFFCPHGPDDQCRCRKPGTGLFEDIARRYDIELAGVPAVGDSLRDLQAAAACGCAPWLVQTGNGAATSAQPLPARTQVCADLAAFTHNLLQQESARTAAR